MIEPHELLPTNASPDDPLRFYLARLLERALTRLDELKAQDNREFAQQLIVCGSQDETVDAAFTDEVWLDLDLHEPGEMWNRPDYFGFGTLSGLIRANNASAAGIAYFEVSSEEPTTNVYLGAVSTRGPVKPIGGPIPVGGSRIPAAFYAEVKVSPDGGVEKAAESHVSPGFVCEMLGGLYPQKSESRGAPESVPAEIGELAEHAAALAGRKDGWAAAAFDEGGELLTESFDDRNALSLMLPNQFQRRNVGGKAGFQASRIVLARRVDDVTEYLSADRMTPPFAFTSDDPAPRYAGDHPLADVIAGAVGMVTTDRLSRIGQGAKHVIGNEGSPTTQSELDSWSGDVLDILVDHSRISDLMPYEPESEIAQAWKQHCKSPEAWPAVLASSTAANSPDSSGVSSADQALHAKRLARMREAYAHLESTLDRALDAVPLELNEVLVASSFREHPEAEGFAKNVHLHGGIGTESELLESGAITQVLANIRRAQQAEFKNFKRLDWSLAAFRNADGVHCAIHHSTLADPDLTLSRFFAGEEGNQATPLSNALAIAVGAANADDLGSSFAGQENSLAQHREALPAEVTLMKAAAEALKGHDLVVVFSKDDEISIVPFDDSKSMEGSTKFFLEAPQALRDSGAEHAVLAYPGGEAQPETVFTLASVGEVPAEVYSGNLNPAGYLGPGQSLLHGVGGLTSRWTSIHILAARGLAETERFELGEDIIDRYAGDAISRDNARLRELLIEFLTLAPGVARLEPLDADDELWGEVTREIPGGWQPKKVET